MFEFLFPQVIQHNTNMFKKIIPFMLLAFYCLRSSRSEVICKKRNFRNSGENTRMRNEVCNFIKKETLAQVFSLNPVNFAKFLSTPFLTKDLRATISPDCYQKVFSPLYEYVFTFVGLYSTCSVLFTSILQRSILGALTNI